MIVGNQPRYRNFRVGGPSPSTLVPLLRPASSHRFFPGIGSKMIYELAPSAGPFKPSCFSRAASPSPRQTRAGLGSYADYGHSCSSRYHRAGPVAAGCGLLLPLSQRPCARRLREDVRDPEVRVPLVGHHLRSPAPAIARRNSGGHSAPATSRPCGTRKTRDATRGQPLTNRIFVLDGNCRHWNGLNRLRVAAGTQFRLAKQFR
jgi:hypothetical protein